MRKIYIIALLIFIVCALFAGLYFYNRKGKISTETEASVQVVTGVLNKIDIEKNIVELDIVLEKINNGKVEITTLENKTFTINKNTEIIKFDTNTIINKVEFDTKQEKFSRLLASLKKEGKSVDSLEAPSWYRKEKISLRNLKIGERVSVYYSGHDLLVATKLVVAPEKKFELDKNILSNLDLEEFDFWGDVISYDGKNNYLNLKDINNIVDDKPKKVLINEDTLIEKNIKKTQEEFDKELEVFNNEINLRVSTEQNINDLVAPQMHVSVAADISDLSPGVRVKATIINRGDLLFAKVIVIN